MAKPNVKLATSLAHLEKLQKGGRQVFRSSELKRVHRERLIRTGFLCPVVKGWLILSSPNSNQGDTTPWFSSFWEFCSTYCNARFGDDWYLSAEQSLQLHAENTVIPGQVIVYTPKGTNNNIELLFETSLYDLKQSRMLPESELTTRNGLRLLAPEVALIRVAETFFAQNPIDSRIVLSDIDDSSDLLNHLLNGGHSSVAGRLVGALRKIGRKSVADEILTVMKSAGYDVRESDPFETGRNICPPVRGQSPIENRLRSLWEISREPVVETFPEAYGLPKSTDTYLTHVDDIYQHDAYHSLSIEGYRVTPELIERVREGDWDPHSRETDRQTRDALAARGYWQSFRLVREAVAEVIGGANPGTLARSGHRDWYRELFQPSVDAGLISVSALAGYRRDSVFLRGSRYAPPRWEAVRGVMPVLFDLLENETESSVRAVLGHWLFGYIHPYSDGNGRIARFLMNVMLASGGYPWTVVRVENRAAYLSALEHASINSDIEPFARFIADEVQWSTEQADQVHEFI